MRETKRPRSVQTIMRIVIRLDRYGPDEYSEAAQNPECVSFMCIAARIALDHHEITPEEYERVVTAIERYLGTSNMLYSAMRHARLTPSMSTDEFARTVGRELYWNWNKRPDLTPKTIANGTRLTSGALACALRRT